MAKWAKRTAHNMLAAVARILFIFLVLAIGFDSLSRIYYSYMPVETWMDFQKVEVKMVEDEAVAILTRKPATRVLSIFHRTLVIRYPDERRGCTNSTVTVIDDPEVQQVTVPLSRMLSENCPELLGSRSIEGVLQVSYIFEFPYGVKRLAVRYSNLFALRYAGRYLVSHSRRSTQQSALSRGDGVY